MFDIHMLKIIDEFYQQRVSILHKLHVNRMLCNLFSSSYFDYTTYIINNKNQTNELIELVAYIVSTIPNIIKHPAQIKYKQPNNVIPLQEHNPDGACYIECSNLNHEADVINGIIKHHHSNGLIICDNKRLTESIALLQLTPTNTHNKEAELLDAIYQISHTECKAIDILRLIHLLGSSGETEIELFILDQVQKAPYQNINISELASKAGLEELSYIVSPINKLKKLDIDNNKVLFLDVLSTHLIACTSLIPGFAETTLYQTLNGLLDHSVFNQEVVSSTEYLIVLRSIIELCNMDVIKGNDYTISTSDDHNLLERIDNADYVIIADFNDGKWPRKLDHIILNSIPTLKEACNSYYRGIITYTTRNKPTYITRAIKAGSAQTMPSLMLSSINIIHHEADIIRNSLSKNNNDNAKPQIEVNDEQEISSYTLYLLATNPYAFYANETLACKPSNTLYSSKVPTISHIAKKVLHELDYSKDLPYDTTMSFATKHLSQANLDEVSLRMYWYRLERIAEFLSRNKLCHNTQKLDASKLKFMGIKCNKDILLLDENSNSLINLVTSSLPTISDIKAGINSNAVIASLALAKPIGRLLYIKLDGSSLTPDQLELSEEKLVETKQTLITNITELLQKRHHLLDNPSNRTGTIYDHLARAYS